MERGALFYFTMNEPNTEVKELLGDSVFLNKLFIQRGKKQNLKICTYYIILVFYT